MQIKYCVDTLFFGSIDETAGIDDDHIGICIIVRDLVLFKTSKHYFTIGVQGGTIDPDGLDKTTGYGVKIAGKLGMFDLSAAYTSVDDGTVKMANFGTSVKTPLYTQSILDQDTISLDSDTFKIAASTKVLGGTVGLAYINSDLGDAAIGATMYPTSGTGAGTYDEVDLTYKTTIGENTTLFAAYVYQNDDRVAVGVPEQQDFMRFWARYNF